MDQKFDFTEEQILEALHTKGFSLMPPISADVITGYTKQGRLIASSGRYLNVKSQNISDLVLAIRKGFPANVSEETLLKIEQLKRSLETFAKNHS